MKTAEALSKSDCNSAAGGRRGEGGGESCYGSQLLCPATIRAILMKHQVGRERQFRACPSPFYLLRAWCTAALLCTTSACHGRYGACWELSWEVACCVLVSKEKGDGCESAHFA